MDWKRHATLRVFFGSQFGLYLSGNTLSMTGTWMQRIACSWLVWDWTHSAFWVGILAASDLLPIVAIAPFAGVAADRYDRLKMNVISQVLSAINTVVLGALLVTEHLELFTVIALTFVQGSLTAATQPSRFAMVQQMVERRDVGTAVGLNSTCVNVARLTGPAAAGALILNVDISLIFLVNAAVTVIFVLVLLRLTLAEPATRRKPVGLRQEMSEGFVHVARTPELRLILFLLFGGGLIVRSVVELMPAIAAQAFGEDVTGLAVLTGSAAVGSVISGLTVGQSTNASLLFRAPLFWAGGGLAAVLLANAGDPFMASLSAVVLGAAITRGLVTTQTFIQLTTPDALRGRALSVFGLVARGSPAIGAIIVGSFADWIGLGPTVIGSAIILAVLLALSTKPVLRAASAMEAED